MKFHSLLSCAWAVSLCVSSITAWAQLGPPAAEFFRPAADAGRDLPPDEVYPRGRLFPFTEIPGQLEEVAHGRIRDGVRHDVYLALISGARSVVFSARCSANPSDRDAYRHAYEELSRELNTDPGLGAILLFGERREGVLIEVFEGPPRVSTKGHDPEVTYPSVRHLDMAWGRERYIFAVNSADEPVRAMVGTLPYGNTRVQSLFRDEKDFLVEEGDFEAEFGPMEAKVFRIFRK